MNLKLLVVLPFISFTLSAQYTKNEKVVKTLIQERSIYLNSGLRSGIEGSSRIIIPIDLPQNTIEWYYSFTTKEGVSGNNNLNLALQLSTFAIDPSGTSSSLLGQISVPGGSSTIDVFHLGIENTTAFTEKYDQFGGTFSYIREGTVQNTKQAVVQIDDVTKGRCYLGIRNPSTLDGVYVKIEVIAIVLESIYVDEWTNESKRKIYAPCVAAFKTEKAGKEAVCDCVVQKIISQNLPSQWQKIPQSSQNQIIMDSKERCFAETNNIELQNAEKDLELRLRYNELIAKADKLTQENKLSEALKYYKDASIIFTKEPYPTTQIKILEEKILNTEKENERLNVIIENFNKLKSEAFAAAQVGDYSEAIMKQTEAITMLTKESQLIELSGNSRMASYYNSLAYWCILTNQLDFALENLKKGLSFEPTNMYLRGNLGVYHLLKGNYSDAEKAFLTYNRNEKLPNGMKWADAIGDDLKTLEERGITNSNFDQVRILLKIKN